MQWKPQQGAGQVGNGVEFNLTEEESGNMKEAKKLKEVFVFCTFEMIGAQERHATTVD